MADREKVRSARRGDVYLVSVDPTVGAEIQKTRPASVIVWNLANLEAAQDLFLDEPPCVGRQEPHLFGQSGRDNWDLRRNPPRRSWVLEDGDDQVGAPARGGERGERSAHQPRRALRAVGCMRSLDDR